VSGQRIREIAIESGLTFTNGNPGVGTIGLEMPRIGLHQAWVASMDAGWISYLFDEHGIPFQAVHNAEIRAGELRDRFDVLVFPDQGSRDIVDGHPLGTVPPDYVGGIGREGIAALREFVEEGGRLVCNNRSCSLPMEYFDLPVEDVLAGVPADSFNCPGAILKADFDNQHPLAFGMPDRGMVFFSGGRAFKVKGDDAQAEEGGELAPPQVHVVASYPDEPLLLSGWMIGDERLRERAGVLDVSMGEGRVVLFGFNVHNRAQARSTAKLLFNALLLR
jgi:hypothetical protein